jgi:hypothetical protein
MSQHDSVCHDHLQPTNQPTNQPASSAVRTHLELQLLQLQAVGPQQLHEVPPQVPEVRSHARSPPLHLRDPGTGDTPPPGHLGADGAGVGGEDAWLPGAWRGQMQGLLHFHPLCCSPHVVAQ